MIRTTTLKLPFLATVLSGLLLASATAQSQALNKSNAASEFSIEGRYELVNPPQPTSDPTKVEVVEIFWYGCPHCSAFQPYIDPWQANIPDHVAFIRMPAIFNKSWEVHARAYYTSKALDTLEKTHSQIFDRIHKAKRPLDKAADIKKFFAVQGIRNEDFDKAYNSFAVDSGVRKSRVMQKRYALRGVPAVIVNGKYRVSSSTAKSYPNMIKVINGLIAKEHAALKAQAGTKTSS